MSGRKRIAVIGAGAGGMLSTAMLKEEDMEPVCFEKTNDPGGTWFYREEPVLGVGSIMPTTIINHCKEMGAFSNFPPSEENNNFMRHGELHQYFMRYWKKIDGLRHVTFNTEAVAVRRTADYDRTGRWTVTVRNTKTGETSTDEYDGVLVCTGHINRPKMPTYPGQGKFRGKIMHTHSLKEVGEFKKQNVLVVGMGCSGLDAAVETSHVAKQVYLSTRSGAHVLSRVFLFGIPFDAHLLRRCFTFLLDLLPARWLSWLCERVFYQYFHHDLYKVPPNHHFLAKDPIFNDHLHSKLMSGSVVLKREIDRFTEEGVVFQGEEEQVTNVDAVIMATGYTWKFPFMEDGVVVKDEAGKINLYKCMYPPQLKHQTLAIIGFILTIGPGFPCGELQCRVAARVLSGKCRLPDLSAMMKDIEDRHRYNLKRYLPCEKMTIRVDFQQYADELASLIGVKPDILKLLFTDISLFYKIVFGPSVPYQYRLQGPHKWEGARDAIMTSDKRMMAPLNKDKKSLGNAYVILHTILRIFM